MAGSHFMAQAYLLGGLVVSDLDAVWDVVEVWGAVWAWDAEWFIHIILILQPRISHPTPHIILHIPVDGNMSEIGKGGSLCLPFQSLIEKE
jgi:hypothetical protein